MDVHQNTIIIRIKFVSFDGQMVPEVYPCKKNTKRSSRGKWSSFEGGTSTIIPLLISLRRESKEEIKKKKGKRRKSTRQAARDKQSTTVLREENRHTAVTRFAGAISKWRGWFLRNGGTGIDSVFKDNENVKRMQKYTRYLTAPRTSLSYARLTTDLFISPPPLISFLRLPPSPYTMLARTRLRNARNLYHL